MRTSRGRVDGGEDTLAELGRAGPMGHGRITRNFEIRECRS